jgi:hypothetical protein
MNNEAILRQIIRKKIKATLQEQKNHEEALRRAIRSILAEGDISDTHPHRSTGINMLEDVLKKSIPTLRADFKRLTTDRKQRDSFRAHIIKAIKDALMPSLVNDKYRQGSETGEPSALLSEPTGDASVSDELDELEEAEIELSEVDVDISDEEKKIPVEKDDEPSPEEQFGSGLEDMDETGRNMAYTSFRKVSQYMLDAYDSLANPKDKEIFLDYLVTNLKLYFDKFESELASTVEEPTTPEYDSAKQT